MATTTTNFGWDIPQSTDLVKDGATAIAALGQDIDTAFVDLKGGTTGQVLKKTSATDLDFEWGTAASGLTLLNTTSFTGVTSIALADNSFSSTYDHYKIIYKFVSTDTGSIVLRLRTGGTNATGANYNYYDILTTAAAGPSRQGGSNDTSMFLYLHDSGAVNRNNIVELNIFNPFIAMPTTVQGNATNLTVRGAQCNGDHTLSTSYDSVALIITGGLMNSGSYSLYGFNK